MNIVLEFTDYSIHGFTDMAEGEDDIEDDIKDDRENDLIYYGEQININDSCMKNT